MPVDRTDFLLKMYDQMFNDINTHILVIWQSVAVVVGAFALLGLVEKSVISLDVAAALIILLCAWLLAHVEDASYWYNRNLVIIANIERQFLTRDDLRNIHYYFGKHRSKSSMLTHLKIQYFLGASLAFLFLLIHFLTRVSPGFRSPWSDFEWERTLPYLVSLASALFLTYIHKNRELAYLEFLKNSPGKLVTTEGIVYGVGHPTDPAAGDDIHQETVGKES